MRTTEELQAEADRRASELAHAATLRAAERHAIYEEIKRRDEDFARAAALDHAQTAERQKLLEKEAREKAEYAQLQENERKRTEQADYNRKVQEAEFALSTEGQVLSYLKDLTASSKATADSVRQIRNFIAATMIFWTLVFILGISLRRV
jgi:hypothetical protein